MDFTEFDVIREPRGEKYAEFLRYLARFAESFGLVYRTDMRRAHEGYLLVRESLSVDAVSSTLVKEWPGTVARDAHELVMYSVGHRSIEALLRLSAGLYDWSETRRPADLHFVRPDGSLLFGCCGSERFAWLKLTGDEVAKCPSEVMRLLTKRRMPTE